MDGFWCSGCLNDRIDLPHMIGSFPGGATSSMVAKNWTKKLSQPFEELQGWNSEFKLITPKTISGTYSKTNLSRFGLADFPLAAILDTLGQSWDHFWTIWGLYLEYFGTILEQFWDYFRTTLGLFWDYFGTIMGPFWDHFGNTLWHFWDYFWSIFGTFLGTIFGPFLDHFGTILVPF